MAEMRTRRKISRKQFLRWSGPLALAALIAAPAPAAAQQPEAPAEAPAAAPRLVPPIAIEAAEPTYPPDARDAGVEGAVVVLITVGADGSVTNTEIAQSASPLLDAAALEAAAKFRFEPARRDGVAMAARIPHRFDFRLPPPAPPPAPPPPAAQVAALQEEAIEVTVEGTTEGERLRRSARAVQVIETEQARRESADLGEVLARNEGVSVRRTGGLGSQSSFGLNGLSGDRVRFFLDGIPLEFAGYPFGVANVPVNLVDRVEVYRGVVPVAFGADALGGAVNLVSEPLAYGSGGNASYQIGSFGTHRATAGARHLADDSGFYARVDGFYDVAANDYEVDAEVYDRNTGRVSVEPIERQHDGYRAFGVALESGWIDRPFADRLAFRGFYTDQLRELQHNRTMKIPFGAVETARQSAGGSVTFESGLWDDTSLHAVAGYAFTRLGLDDTESCGFDWFGKCLPAADRPTGGELSTTTPYDQNIDQHAVFARVQLAWELDPAHELRLALAPTWTTRDGRNEAVSADIDTTRGERGILSLVSGIEYEARPFGGDLENILFVKSYVQDVTGEELQSSSFTREVERTTTRFGVGDSLRYRLAEPLYAKASYELATRLPNPEELFGNGDLIVQNLDLEPEVSHNVNVGFALERVRTLAGGLRLDVNGFARFTDNLILQVPKDNFVQHQNVFSATSIGVEAAAGWLLPGDWLELNANATWQDFRNTSTEGAFAQFEGDRITNTPWLFANFSARTRFENVLAADDAFSAAWITRWINEFNTGWDVGSANRLAVPDQLLHTVHLGYSRDLDGRLATLGVEMDNLTDRKNFDYFGVQRPGRALFAKLTLEL